MKISELIGLLQNSLSRHGDLQVLVDYDDIGEIDYCKNYSTKEMYVNIKPEECL